MTVEDWGTGRPDFSATTFPARTEVETTRQEDWSQNIGPVVPANSAASNNSLYTVPTGKRLVLSMVRASVNIDHIVSFVIRKNSVAYIPMWLTASTDMALPDTGPYVFDAADVVGYAIQNRLGCTLVVRAQLMGFLHDI